MTTSTSKQMSSGSVSDTKAIRNESDSSTNIQNNKKRPYSSKIDNDYSGSIKFDAILNCSIDTLKINLKTLEEWLRERLRTNSFSHHDLMTDLIVDFIGSERYPDPKVLQCDLADFGLLDSEQVKRLMSRVWYHLIDQQENYHNSKHRKTSDSSKLSTSSDSHPCTNNQRYYSQSVDQCR